ncbi:hypothetical protein B0A55_02328 [Friedmanniomyces simplex]|uniref:Heterokaryon incompatibility domain-containing protein n=1 Tax=Friedmanniomyces simplex TaxID=329884 RepID=A0A4U0XVS0_9PEZI|nr:hypothetical protein B0A55_02328 [Friedmanniomyces simplex]
MRHPSHGIHQRALPNATCYRHLTLSELSSVLHIPDERARCALDHAVVTDDFEAEQMVLEARRLKLSPGDVEGVIHQSIKDARLRKHYEELFQKTFLPALTASRDIDLHRIRRTTEVAPEFLHATLFYFDSSRGFVQTAPVLGPKDAESSTQLRDAAGIDALTLAGKVESVRAWEEVLEGARRLAGSGQWALALEAFSAALAMCCPHGSLPNATCYRHLTLSELSSVLHIPDERGRCALDHAVVTDDFEAEQMVLEARRLKLSPGDVESVIHQSIKDARLRKHYEELFQKSFLPALTASRDIDLHRIRRTYAETLATDTAKRRAFDNLKYVRYTDLVDFGRFPRSTDGLTQEYHVLEPGSRPATPILFFSHRWIHPDPWAQAPSAAEHTQYKRVLAAAAAFLTLHPKVEQADLSIWIDYACIDQEHPLSGIAALPMVLAQCDALISLVDEEYHGRAWCSVEVLMAQALQRVCGRRVWYEHVEQFGQTGEDAAADGLHAGLREGPKDVYTTLAGKRLRFEEDRSKVLFLERQIRLFLTTGPRAPGGEDV